MISPEEIKNKAARKYKDFLRYEIELHYGDPEKPFFPLIIRADTGCVNDDLFKRQKDKARWSKPSSRLPNRWLCYARIHAKRRR